MALFLFGLVNAGVPLQGVGLGHAQPAAHDAGGQAGRSVVGVGVALALGLHLPHRVGWRELMVVGFVSTIGFTGALFFATATLGPGPTLSALKMGALVSISGALLAVGAAEYCGPEGSLVEPG